MAVRASVDNCEAPAEIPAETIKVNTRAGTANFLVFLYKFFLQDCAAEAIKTPFLALRAFLLNNSTFYPIRRGSPDRVTHPLPGHARGLARRLSSILAAG